MRDRIIKILQQAGYSRMFTEKEKDWLVAELKSKAMKYEKFCEQHGLSVEAQAEGVYDCHAHLAEGRCRACPYNSPAERLAAEFPCSDFKAI